MDIWVIELGHCSAGVVGVCCYVQSILQPLIVLRPLIFAANNLISFSGYNFREIFMRRFLLSSLAFTALAGFSGTALAEAQTYVLDKPHTQILFFVNHMGLGNSSGEFTDYSGQIVWDKEKPADASVDVTINTDSLDMGDATWDEHTKAEKFFNVAKFPTMTFKSTKVEVTGDKTANITGDLTLLGVTKPVVLATTLVGAAEHPFKKVPAAGFSATTHIKRSDFGMTEAIPMVGDDVEIRIEVEAAVAGAENQ